MLFLPLCNYHAVCVLIGILHLSEVRLPLYQTEWEKHSLPVTHSTPSWKGQKRLFIFNNGKLYFKNILTSTNAMSKPQNNAMRLWMDHKAWGTQSAQLLKGAHTNYKVHPRQTLQSVGVCVYNSKCSILKLTQKQNCTVPLSLYLFRERLRDIVNTLVLGIAIEHQGNWPLT